MDVPGNSPDFRGKRVTVMGLGRFGGGLGAVRFLAQRGARVIVTDLQTADDLADVLPELEGLPLEALHLGGHREDDFLDADLVVVNPAVPPGNRFVRIAREAGVPTTSELALFWQLQRGRLVGVSGSNGKSTTSGLVHAMLEAAGLTCRLGGNIGRSLLPEVGQIGPDDWTVLELSSFQLADLDRLFTSPDVAVVTNFRPNHLDWHGCLDDYRRSKQAILRWQTPEGTAVLNRDDADVRTWPTNGRRAWFGTFESLDELVDGEDGVFAVGRETFVRIGGKTTAVPLCDWLTLPGEHNLMNAMAAAAAALTVGVDLEAVRGGLERFQPLPHRLQFVVEVAGRRFYDDSLATTPESAIAALEAFDAPIVLLAGGYDKHVDLSEFAAAIVRRSKAVALMGQTAGELATLLTVGGDEAPIPLRVCDEFGQAFRWAVERSQAGDVVLLSPGCASYDWFRNFAERGDRFAELARGWNGEV